MSAGIADDPILLLERVHKCYVAGAGRCRASVRALAGVSLEVRRAEVVAVVGGAGAGKSTLLLCAAGLLRPDRGRVLVGRSDARARTEDVLLLSGPAGGRAIRRLSSTPMLMLLDGVLDSLDDCDRARVDARVAHLAAEGSAVLIATRAAAAVRSVASRVAHLDLGTLRDAASPPVAVRVAERVPP